MTEYSSTLFILFALLVFNENSKTNIFLSGVFISLAFFTRTNTAFVAVAFFLYLLKKKRINVFNIWWINPTNNFSLLYLVKGEFLRFVYAIILTPLDNTLYRQNFITILLDSYRSIFIENSFIPLLFLIFLILTFVMYILSQNFRMKLIIEIRRSKLLIITFLSLCISILVQEDFIIII